MPQEKSAGAIIYRLKDGVPSYLLLHYHGGHWEFARGHFEQGEDELKTVRREVKEETGIQDLEILPGFKGYSKFVFKRTWGLSPEEKKKAPWTMKIVTLYLAKTKTETVKISDEHKGFGWFSFDDAVKKLPKDAKKVFRKAHEHLIGNKKSR
ncbi:MAG: NUDIX domain-containing protein [bacterium]|nr:NUDIX domain-containing protein [bacterium]